MPYCSITETWVCLHTAKWKAHMRSVLTINICQRNCESNYLCMPLILTNLHLIVPHALQAQLPKDVPSNSYQQLYFAIQFCPIRKVF